MITQDALTRFFKNCQERGLSPATVNQYYAYLKHFQLEYPELPLTTKQIEDYLRKRGETPAHRGEIFKRLQAFYSYLEREENIKSPVPPRGAIGRPQKQKKLIKARQTEIDLAPDEKLVKGGRTLSSSTSLSTQTAIDWFLHSRQATTKQLSKATFVQYNWVFTQFLARFPILPLTPEPLESFFASRTGSPATRWNIKKVLRAFYHFLKARKGLPNPMADIVVGNTPRQLRTKLNQEQIKLLFQLPLSFHDRALLMLIFDIGLRSGEICNLRPKDIQPGSITIDGKTGRHEIPIKQETYEILSQLTLMSGKDTVFYSTYGPMQHTFLYTKIRRWLGEIGVTEGRRGSHMLRHSFAPSYLLHGGTLQDLSQILGHRNLSTTAIYAEMTQAQLKEQHDKFSPLNELLGKTDAWQCACQECGQEMFIPIGEMPETKCPGCGQTGAWYTKNLYKQGALV